MPTINPYILAGFETLHFVAKQTFFNRFYFAQALWSFLFVLSLPLNKDVYQGFDWDPDALAPSATHQPRIYGLLHLESRYLSHTVVSLWLSRSNL